MKLLSLLGFAAIFLLPSPVFAATNNQDVTNFTNQTLNTFLVFASIAAVFFLVRGGYIYITSTGKPDALEHAKMTVRNALIGLVLIIGATVFSSLLTNAFNTPSANTSSAQLSLSPIETVKPADGLTQVLIDAIAGFLQNIIQSATKPITDGIISFLTTSPVIITNSVIFNFWLVILGITDSLFALLIAVLGFHFMSASTFGFEEIEFKHLLPRIGLSFLGANMSIFLVDWINLVCNTMVKALLNATGGINNAWISNAFDPASLTSGSTVLITPIFMLLFLILSIVLLLFYVTRLITIALGAVLSPLICLLWAIPKFSDVAEISVKTYITAVFTVFVHVVIIQLASSFLSVPGQSGTNSLVSILVGIGLLFTLLKTPSIMMQLIFYNTGRGMMRKIGGQIMNVISSSGSQTASKLAGAASNVTPITPRRRVAA
jgi:hypothetical protein